LVVFNYISNRRCHCQRPLDDRLHSFRQLVTMPSVRIGFSDWFCASSAPLQFLHMFYRERYDSEHILPSKDSILGSQAERPAKKWRIQLVEEDNENDTDHLAWGLSSAYVVTIMVPDCPDRQPCRGRGLQQVSQLRYCQLGHGYLQSPQ